MTQSPDTKALLDAAKQIMTAAGCASLITVDESGLPSSRAVRTFLSDDSPYESSPHNGPPPDPLPD